MNEPCTPAVSTRALEVPTTADFDTFTFLEVDCPSLSDPW